MTARLTNLRAMLSVVAAVAFTPGAWALPLAPEACERARTEQDGLNAQGIAGDVAKGGAWGRDNLGRERLAQVARWIELEEQLLFQCPRPPIEAKAQSAASGAESKGTDDASKGKPAEKSPRKDADGGADKPAKPKPEPAPAAKPKPKPKPRDDAYIPPAPLSGQEFQHATPGAPEPALPWSSLAP